MILVDAPSKLAAALVVLPLLAGCDVLGTGPEETGPATVQFVTYPGEVEPGNIALFTLVGYLPSPCYELSGTGASLDENRIRLTARWSRPTGAGACPGVVEPFQAEVALEVPAGWDSLAVTVADSVWDQVSVLVDAPGFKKAAGELGSVDEVDGAPGCHRGQIGSTDRGVVLTEPPGIARPFVVGRLTAGVPEGCADADLENVLGTLEVETAY